MMTGTPKMLRGCGSFSGGGDDGAGEATCESWRDLMGLGLGFRVSGFGFSV